LALAEIEPQVTIAGNGSFRSCFGLPRVFRLSEKEPRGCSDPLPAATPRHSIANNPTKATERQKAKLHDSGGQPRAADTTTMLLPVGVMTVIRSSANRVLKFTDLHGLKTMGENPPGPTEVEVGFCSGGS